MSETRVHADTKVALAALAIASGSLDVTAFLRLGGLFASVMTSNLIFVGLAAVKAEATLAEHCVTALVCYVVGVGVGTSIARPSGGGSGGGGESRIGTFRLSLLLTVEAVLLFGYAAWWIADGAGPAGWQQLTLLGAVAFAMGLQGAAARLLGDPAAGTTYLTGSLTGMATAVMTGRRPDTGAAFAIAGVVAGAAAGAALLDNAPDLTPLLAVAGVAFTAAMSWNERRHVVH